MTRLGIIADDFTGATDVAGLAVRKGASASVIIGGQPEQSPNTVTVHALKIRSAPRDDAIRTAADAARHLLSEGRRLYWKYCSTFDSTPEGNIGPVADRLLELTGARRAIHCPAFPENGRTVYKGQLFVGNLPLDESPMRDHPLTPMRDANLMRLLAPQVSGPVGLLTRETILAGRVSDHVARNIPDDCRHLIADAITDDDLAALADQCPVDALLCGGSAFAAAVLSTDAAVAPPVEIPDGPVLVLSGSCSAATRAQVAAWSGPHHHLSPETLASKGGDAALEWLRESLGERPVLISATVDPDRLRASQETLGADRAAGLVEGAMAALAIEARNRGAAGLVVAGGETSGAVSTALGVRRLQIGAEVAPGVPLCLAQSEGRKIALVLKSGNFGGPDFFTEAAHTLKGGI
jgi:uncharacterized protein YgbK (DUF1537 family)